MIVKHNIKKFVFLSRLDLKLYKTMVCEKGQRFTLRDGNTTLGTGVITNLLPPLTDAEKVLLSEGKKGIKKMEKKAGQ